MTRSVFVLSQAIEGGWHLSDQGRAMFWFAEKEAGLEVARSIAERGDFHSGKRTAVDLILLQRPFERIITYD